MARTEERTHGPVGEVFFDGDGNRWFWVERPDGAGDTVGHWRQLGVGSAGSRPTRSPRRANRSAASRTAGEMTR